MNRIQRVVLSVGVAAMAVVGTNGTAWAYGVEGWPNGKPDHVVKTLPAKSQPAKVSSKPAKRESKPDARTQDRQAPRVKSAERTRR